MRPFQGPHLRPPLAHKLTTTVVAPTTFAPLFCLQTAACSAYPLARLFWSSQYYYEFEPTGDWYRLPGSRKNIRFLKKILLDYRRKTKCKEQSCATMYRQPSSDWLITRRFLCTILLNKTDSRSEFSIIKHITSYTIKCFYLYKSLVQS